MKILLLLSSASPSFLFYFVFFSGSTIERHGALLHQGHSLRRYRLETGEVQNGGLRLAYGFAVGFQFCTFPQKKESYKRYLAITIFLIRNSFVFKKAKIMV